jgi:hypothetical protein
MSTTNYWGWMNIDLQQVVRLNFGIQQSTRSGASFSKILPWGAVRRFKLKKNHIQFRSAA